MPEYVTQDEARRMVEDAIAEAKKTLKEPRPLKLFGLDGTKDYAGRVARRLGTELTPHTEEMFEDGEWYMKSGPARDDTSLGNVRGHIVVVIQSLYSDERESVADKFVKLCMFCGSLKDASAHEVIAVLPHMGWARQDRKTESRAPVGTKYVARMIESVGIDRVVMFDAHNLAAEQNAFRVPIDNLETKNLFADWCADALIAEGKTDKIRVLTPDSGGLGRCERFRNALMKRFKRRGFEVNDIEIAIFDKIRVNGRVQGDRIIGDVAGAQVIAYDDMISTGGTMAKACHSTMRAGGEIFSVCATHGLFCGKANEHLGGLGAKIVVADTIRPWRLDGGNLQKLVVIDTAKMMADAINRLYTGTGSISELLRA